MNLQDIAQQWIAVLIPLFPFLSKGTAAAAEEIGKRLGEHAVEKVSRLWNALRGDPKTKAAIDILVADPQDKAWREVLVTSAISVLERHPELLKDISDLLTQSQQVTLDASEAANIEQIMKSNGSQEVTLKNKSKVRDIKQNMT